MKTISASKNGITISYDNSDRSSFIKYEQTNSLQIENNLNLKRKRILYNPVQQSMMNRLMKGLTYYSEKELNAIPSEVRKLIDQDYEKAQFAIRKLKVNKYYYAENKLLNAIFPHIKLGSKIIDYYTGCADAINQSLNKLNISMEEVADSFIEHHLLPSDFKEFTPSYLSEKLNS